MPKSVDICIIGGGPAGSVLAAQLAQFGLQVSLLEKEVFPRRHLGESLSPGVLPLLESLGARQAIERAEFPRVRNIRVRWDEHRDRQDPTGQGMLVDRGRFDLLLLDHARNCGVHILQPATATTLHRAENGWKITARSGSRHFGIQARFIAEASGRAALLPRTRHTTGPKTIAVYAYWIGTRVPCEPRIEAGDNHWLWGVPLPEGLYNTLVFINPRDLRRMTGTLNAKFRKLIFDSSLLPSEARAEIMGNVEVCDATPYLDEACVSENSIKVGEAALAIDPLSSSGVQKAIQSALAASAVVNTLLRRPRSKAVAIQFYQNNLRNSSIRHRAWARSHYALVATKRSAKFWQERADVDALNTQNPQVHTPPVPPNTRLQVAPGVQIIQQPCLIDRFIELRPAVISPSLASPVAFVAGAELAPLLQRVVRGSTPLEIIKSWLAELTPAMSVSLTHWLFAHRVLVPLPEPERGVR